MLDLAMRSSTPGHTAACSRLYSAMRSAAMPMTMPMRFKKSLRFGSGGRGQGGPEPGLCERGRALARRIDDGRGEALLLPRVVRREVGQAMGEERIAEPVAQRDEVVAGGAAF